MELRELGSFELTYRTLEMLDYGAGGQIYGTMEGLLKGDRLSGSLSLTNLASRRPDNVNLPTLRGLLATPDGANIWVELDGIATLRAEDGARVFVTSARFRSGDERYRWLDGIVGLLEGVLDKVGVGGGAHGRLWECRATVA
jgi:hypothetical protein